MRCEELESFKRADKGYSGRLTICPQRRNVQRCLSHGIGMVRGNTLVGDHISDSIRVILLRGGQEQIPFGRSRGRIHEYLYQLHFDYMYDSQTTIKRRKMIVGKAGGMDISRV